jgi:hypothetical protein
MPVWRWTKAFFAGAHGLAGLTLTLSKARGVKLKCPRRFLGLA